MRFLTNRKKPVSHEHREQVALFRWASMNKNKYPALGLMFAIPNGGQRHVLVARKLKAEGVKAGVPDICLPVPQGIHAGLFIEMKAGKNKLTPEQKDWCERLMVYGHKVVVCYGWEEAVKTIEEYLSLESGMAIFAKYRDEKGA